MLAANTGAVPWLKAQLQELEGADGEEGSGDDGGGDDVGGDDDADDGGDDDEYGTGEESCPTSSGYASFAFARDAATATPSYQESGDAAFTTFLKYLDQPVPFWFDGLQHCSTDAAAAAAAQQQHCTTDATAAHDVWQCAPSVLELGRVSTRNLHALSPALHFLSVQQPMLNSKCFLKMIMRNDYQVG